MKTLFTIFISIFSVLTATSFPFGPKQFLPLELFIIGIPSVLLAIEPNNERIQGSFLETALARSLPNALALTTPVFVIMLIERFNPNIEIYSRNAMAMVFVTIVGFLNLVTLCTPYTKWRAAVVSLSAVLLTATALISIFLLNDMFNLAPLTDNLMVFFIMLTVSMFVTIVMQIFRGKIEQLIHYHFQMKEKRRREQ
jgi:cation-transporting ATPase E